MILKYLRALFQEWFTWLGVAGTVLPFAVDAAGRFMGKPVLPQNVSPLLLWPIAGCAYLVAHYRMWSKVHLKLQEVLAPRLEIQIEQKYPFVQEPAPTVLLPPPPPIGSESESMPIGKEPIVLYSQGIFRVRIKNIGGVTVEDVAVRVDIDPLPESRPILPASLRPTQPRSKVLHPHESELFDFIRYGGSASGPPSVILADEERTSILLINEPTVTVKASGKDTNLVERYFRISGTGHDVRIACL